MKDITIKKEIIVIVGILLIVGLLVGACLYAINLDKVEAAKSREKALAEGYNQALIDIAYTIAQKGEVIYIIPTTNITIDLVLKK
jgi:hypothetical protein